MFLNSKYDILLILHISHLKKVMELLQFLSRTFYKQLHQNIRSTDIAIVSTLIDHIYIQRVSYIKKIQDLLKNLLLTFFIDQI